jgi:hypothetical protein
VIQEPSLESWTVIRLYSRERMPRKRRKALIITICPIGQICRQKLEESGKDENHPWRILKYINMLYLD